MYIVHVYVKVDYINVGKISQNYKPVRIYKTSLPILLSEYGSEFSGHFALPAGPGLCVCHVQTAEDHNGLYTDQTSSRHHPVPT